MTGWLTDEEHRAWRGLLAMTTRLNARLNRELQRSSGLSLADYDVLVLLSEAPGGRLRVFELAESLQWEQSRLSHHLGRMEGRELVARQECRTDRRGAFIGLTTDGRAAIERAAPEHVALVRRLVFDGLTGAQVATLRTVSDDVLSRLGQSSQAIPSPSRSRS